MSKKGGSKAPEAAAGGSKSLRVPKDVYSRIVHDAAKDASKFVLGYEDRFLGLVEMSLLDFQPNGDVPWHRVYYFEEITDFGRQRIWDRSTKFDAVFGSGNGSRVPAQGFCKPAYNLEQMLALKDADAAAADKLLLQQHRHAAASSSSTATSTTSTSSSSGSSGASGTSGSGSNATTLCAYRFDGRNDEWAMQLPQAVGIGARQPSLSIVSYNVMFEIYDNELHSARTRHPHLFQLLERSDADLIALQEITPTTLQQLLALPWVRERYYASDSPLGVTLAGSGSGKYGQLLLSKFPFANLAQLEFGPQKRVIVGQFLINGRRLVVPVVHLTSDHKAVSTERRREQLKSIFAYLQHVGCLSSGYCVLVGDFNFDDDEHHELLQQPPQPSNSAEARFIDAWLRVHGSLDGGYTFDPETNDVARLASTSSKRRRLDRIYVYSCPHAFAQLQATQCSLLGTEPIAIGAGGFRVFPSDHYGLRAELTYDCDHEQLASAANDADDITSGGVSLASILSRPQSRKVGRKTAVVIVPPNSLWPAIQQIRAEHDKNFKIWMPHINLLYGFIHTEHFAEAATVFRGVLRHMPPFQLRLATMSSFNIRNGHNIQLDIDGDRATHPIYELQRALEAEYPYCNEQSSHSDVGWIPHLTLGQSRTAPGTMLGTWQKSWTPIDFTVRHIYLVARSDSQPFSVWHKIPLARADELSATTTTTSTTARTTVAAAPPAAAPSNQDELHLLTRAPLMPVGTAPTLLGILEANDHVGPASEAQLANRHQLLAHIASICNRIIASNVASASSTLSNYCYEQGSGALGVESPSSDIDLVCIGPPNLSRATFFEALRCELQADKSLEVQKLRTFFTARVPLLTGVISGFEVDVAYAKFPNSLPLCAPDRLTADSVKRFDEQSAFALSGLTDAAAILASLRELEHQHQGLAAGECLAKYRVLLRALKLWAKARALYSASFGYLGGFSWAIIAARAISEARDEIATASHERLFTLAIRMLLDSIDGHRAISIAEHHDDNDDTACKIDNSTPVCVLTPSYPVRNAAASTSFAMGRILRAECERALALLAEHAQPNNAADAAAAASDVLSRLLAPLDFFGEHSHFVVLEVQCLKRADMHRASAWLHSKIAAFVREFSSRTTDDAMMMLLLRALPATFVNLRHKLKANALLDEGVLLNFPHTGACFIGCSNAANAADIEALTRAVASLSNKFVEWSERPDGSRLSVAVLSQQTVLADWLPMSYRRDEPPTASSSQ